MRYRHRFEEILIQAVAALNAGLHDAELAADAPCRQSAVDQACVAIAVMEAC